MQIKKNDVNKTLTFFLFSHLVIWILIPSLSNINLPLDTIEALAWGNELQFGYQKHPPLSAWFLEFFYQIFGSQDWAYYFLSQIFVLLSFIIIFKFSEDFFENPILSLISVLLLEGIYFYNFTTPEFNVNVCQLPFWALTIFYCWKAIKINNNTSWFLFGIFAALGVLTKYLFIYLLVSLWLLPIYIIVKHKKFNPKHLIFLVSFILVLSPHLIWLVDHNYTTIHYAIFRSVDDPLSGFVGPKFLDHIFYPFIFLAKQVGTVIPFFIMFYFTVSKLKPRINYRDKRLLFLISIFIIPLVLVFLTSLITGTRIRTMGITPFYLFTGVFFVYLFQTNIKLNNLKNFILVFLVIFFLSPTAYYLISHTQKDKRTDYPGRKISKIVQTQWENNFSNEIKIVVGDGWVHGGWYAGNLSYHLESRPKWKTKMEKEPKVGTVLIKGFNKINNCAGVLFQIEPFNDICMIGKQ